MIKIVACILIVCLCAVFGFLFCIKYKKRKQFYEEMIRFCKFYSNEIKFKQTKLGIVIELFNSKNNLFSCYQSKTCVSQKYLSDEEEVVVKQFFSSLGRLDVEGELASVESYRCLFESSFCGCEHDYKKYSSIGVKLGISVGLAIVIVLV